jgi:hypothetical protein
MFTPTTHIQNNTIFDMASDEDTYLLCTSNDIGFTTTTGHRIDVTIQYMEVLKHNMVLMYLQNDEALEDFIMRYNNLDKESINQKMKTFYDDIVAAINSSYVLK